MTDDPPRGSRVVVALRVTAAPEAAFAAFTEQIAEWWQPNALFTFTPGKTGRLSFEPGPDGRLVESYDDGTHHTIGQILHWDPPNSLVVTWRPASFDADLRTELHVRFEAVGDAQTRVTVEHFGWDAIPRDHAARHTFPLMDFQRRFAEWWQALLDAYAAALPTGTTNEPRSR